MHPGGALAPRTSLDPISGALRRREGSTSHIGGGHLKSAAWRCSIASYWRSRTLSRCASERARLEHPRGNRRAFSGRLFGQTMLVFPEENYLEIVHAVLGPGMSGAEVEALTDDALGEIGNVLLLGFLSTIGVMLDVQFEVSIPTVGLAKPEEIVVGDEDQVALFIYVNFSISGREVRGYFGLVLDWRPSPSSCRSLRPLSRRSPDHDPGGSVGEVFDAPLTASRRHGRTWGARVIAGLAAVTVPGRRARRRLQSARPLRRAGRRIPFRERAGTGGPRSGRETCAAVRPGSSACRGSAGRTG